MATQSEPKDAAQAGAQLVVAPAGKRDEEKTVTCAGCGAAWPAARLGPGVTIPCTCGRLLVVE